MSSIERLEQASLFQRKAAQDEALLDAAIESDKVNDEIIGFHCQQAADRMLKALLSDLGAAFHKTHELGALVDTPARSGPLLPDEFEDLDTLTPFGAVYRYDDYDGRESLNRTETRRAAVTPLVRKRPPAQPDHFGNYGGILNRSRYFRVHAATVAGCPVTHARRSAKNIRDAAR